MKSDKNINETIKMVIKGIEYAGIQAIIESFLIMKHLLKLNINEIHNVFSVWNNSEPDNKLLEKICERIVTQKENDYPFDRDLFDWSAWEEAARGALEMAIEINLPHSVTAASLMSGNLSEMVELRSSATGLLKGPEPLYPGERTRVVNDLKYALYGTGMVAWAQGLSLLAEAGKKQGLEVQPENSMTLIKNGLMTGSGYVEEAVKAISDENGTGNILLSGYFSNRVESLQKAWRRVVALSIVNGLPAPVMSSALAYYDGLRQAPPFNQIRIQK